MPPALFAATMRAAIQITKGSLGSIGISSSVIELSEGALTMLFVTRLKIAATVLAALGLASRRARPLSSPSGQHRFAGTTRLPAPPSPGIRRPAT